MNIQNSTITRLLSAASAMLWLGTASAAPLPLSNAGSVRAPLTPAMYSAAHVDEIESGEVLAPHLQRQVIDYATAVAAGTIIIDTEQTYLYFVLGGGKAIRYGIGVGRDGFTWSGVQTVTRMAEWPDWTPPPEMIERQPYLARWMAGGKGNPLGARAIYIGSTIYRIHGTNAPGTIGTRVSSGCIRLTDADVTDLYSRVKVGTRIIVLSNQQAGRAAPATSRNPHLAGLRPAAIY
jgi:lipoprotein-anchoring transpeptidase ErfK/SrfK